MWGTTQARTIDGALDEISRLQVEHANALDELAWFVRAHPEHEWDHHLMLARAALL